MLARKNMLSYWAFFLREIKVRQDSMDLLWVTGIRKNLIWVCNFPRMSFFISSLFFFSGTWRTKRRWRHQGPNRTKGKSVRKKIKDSEEEKNSNFLFFCDLFLYFRGELRKSDFPKLNDATCNIQVLLGYSTFDRTLIVLLSKLVIYLQLRSGKVDKCIQVV